MWSSGDVVMWIWVFPKIVGFPPKSSISNRVFHYKPSITPILNQPFFSGSKGPRVFQMPLVFANETGMNLDSKITGPDPKSMEQSEIPDVRKALTFRSPKRLAAWKFWR